MVGTVNSRKMKTGVFKKITTKRQANPGDNFTVSEVEMDGKKTVRSLKGLRRDSEVMFLDREGR